MAGELTVTRGLPASGKTTWAEGESGADLIASRDSIRRGCYGWRKERGPLHHDYEKMVTRIQETMVREGLRAGQHVVVDDMNLRPRYVRRWAELAAEEGAEFEVREFPLTIEESIRRNLQRESDADDFVPAEAILNMRKYLGQGDTLQPVPEPAAKDKPKGIQPYVPDHTKPKAVIVDIDGTLALIGDRDPYDASRAMEDKPNETVLQLLDTLDIDGWRIIFMSGRQECHRDVTEEWLQGLHYGPLVVSTEPLFMRATGDTRKDSIVKAELFDKYVRHNYNVLLALDDRDQVVAQWREMGLACFQVAPGDF